MRAVHPTILDALPGEAQMFYLDQEVDQLSRNLSTEKRKANIVRDMSLLNDLAALDRELLTVKRRKK